VIDSTLPLMIYAHISSELVTCFQQCQPSRRFHGRRSMGGQRDMTPCVWSPLLFEVDIFNTLIRLHTLLLRKNVGMIGVCQTSALSLSGLCSLKISLF